MAVRLVKPHFGVAALLHMCISIYPYHQYMGAAHAFRVDARSLTRRAENFRDGYRGIGDEIDGKTVKTHHTGKL
jgi:hypothetical protein